jgi:hypothetical protein
MKRESKRNPIARALRSPHLRPKTVANKKLYNRKADRKVRLDAFGGIEWLPLALAVQPY